MSLTPEIVEQLKEPMALDRVKTRKAPGGGMVPYIDGADAIDDRNAELRGDCLLQPGHATAAEADHLSAVLLDGRSGLGAQPRRDLIR